MDLDVSIYIVGPLQDWNVVKVYKKKEFQWSNKKSFFIHLLNRIGQWKIFYLNVSKTLPDSN